MCPITLVGAFAGRRAHLVKAEGNLAVIRPVSPVDRRPVLTESRRYAMAPLSEEVRLRHNMPDLDLEWTWQADRLYVLQAKPITAAIASASGQRLGVAAGTGSGMVWSPSVGSTPRRSLCTSSWTRTR